jgi:hypothetical protein
MKLTARSIGVDAGCIMISDLDFYQQYGKRSDGLGMMNEYFDLEIGLYVVKYKVLHTWRVNPPEGEFILNLMSGTLVVSDPCYMIDDWDRFLADTKHTQIVPFNTMIIDTGGDGSFDVKLDLKKEKPSKRRVTK